MVGDAVGSDVVGESVGDAVGSEVVGDAVGSDVVGDSDGDVVGSEVVGDTVGSEVVGDSVGDVVGSEVVGDAVGFEVVGDDVGDAVGRRVHPEQEKRHWVLAKSSRQKSSRLLASISPRQATADSRSTKLGSSTYESQVVGALVGVDVVGAAVGWLVQPAHVTRHTSPIVAPALPNALLQSDPPASDTQSVTASTSTKPGSFSPNF